jgi:hypothetical protein
MENIKYPFGKADVQKPAFANPIAITVKNALTIVQVALTGATTLNVTVDAECPVGAELSLRLTSDATARDTTLGTGIDGPIITGTISKTKSQSFFLDDDGVFKPKGAFAQVD